MKSSPARQLCFLLGLSTLIALQATAGYVVPVVAPKPAFARHIAPPLPAPGTVWVTTDADSGPGSLRNAIANAAPGNTIRFALPLPATINLSSSLVIDKELTILGPGSQKLTVARASGANIPSFRVFRVDDTANASIAGLSIVNGRALNEFEFGDNLGGGIYNEGSLTISNCVIAHNVAPTEGTGNGFGAGIFSSGPLTIINSTLSDNEASFAGGGVCIFHSSTVRIEGSTISGNSAGIQGGGVNFQGLVGTLKNSTISGNQTPADGTASGVLHLVFGNEGSDLDLTTCTIVNNVGTANGAVVFAALPSNLGLHSRITGTLVADNDAPNFFLDGNPVVQSLGHNLDSDGSSGWVNGVNGNLVGTFANPIDARLSALQDNGGPTFTHALLFSSPAVDAGTCSDVNGTPVATDQRGFPRPQGLACDIGAFENQPPQVQCPEEKHIKPHKGELEAVVFDPDGDALSMVWLVDGTTYQTNSISAAHPPTPQAVTLDATLPAGKHTLTLRVSDGKANTVECSSSIKVNGGKPSKSKQPKNAERRR